MSLRVTSTLQVKDTPDDHVTRDYQSGHAKLGDLSFKVFDTSGKFLTKHGILCTTVYSSIRQKNINPKGLTFFKLLHMHVKLYVATLQPVSAPKSGMRYQIA